MRQEPKKFNFQSHLFNYRKRKVGSTFYSIFQPTGCLFPIGQEAMAREDFKICFQSPKLYFFAYPMEPFNNLSSPSHLLTFHLITASYILAGA